MQRLQVARGWGTATWVFILVLSTLFIYRSVQPVMRLRQNPPAEYFDFRSEWDTKRRQAEDRVARAYWDVATKTLPWKYTFGTSLPSDPPPDFSIDPKAVPEVRNADANARVRYWNRIQKVWYLPQAWEKTYMWNTGWLTEGQ